jgi:hypothetical protein
MLSKPIAQPKGPSRLQTRAKDVRSAAAQGVRFRWAVIARDGARCRCCGRRVHQTIDHVPERAEVHHLHGRLGALRYEPRCAILVCAADHERLTGRVNDRLFVEGTAFWILDGERRIDANQRLRFVAL